MQGTAKQAEELHGLITQKLLDKMNDDPSAADIKNAMEWLHRHGITTFALPESEGEAPPTPTQALELLGPVFPDEAEVG